MWSTLIIDDEKLARERLKRLLANYKANFNIIGEATNGNDAATMIEELKPDLIFLDIQMPGKNVFQMLSELHYKPFVIFCTAFDKYALEAFNTHSVDYLLKPVEEERLLLTIEKIEKIGVDANKKLFDKIQDVGARATVFTSIQHKVGNKIVPVKLDDITYFEANDKYVNFYNSLCEEFITEQTLVTLENKLPNQFLRISKSVIINKDYIKELHKYFRGRFIFSVNDKMQTKLTSGGNYNSTVKDVFEL